MEKTAFLFCSSYFDPGKPDEDYADEYRCIVQDGRKAYLFDFDAFLADGTLNIKPSEQPITLIYRGWMFRCESYETLFRALQDKGYTLINSPQQYRQCHHLPSWYGQLRQHTAESVWSNGIPSEETMLNLLRQLGSRPLIVKDYVKSRKHEWSDACYIPDASNVPQAVKVINTFIERQDTDIVGGIVLRECLPLRITGEHPKSDMPIAREVRVFCFRHNPFAFIQYWTGRDGDAQVEYSFLVDACNCLNSNFYTVDIAQLTCGDWIIMEVGDGQVSGLQDYDTKQFYKHFFAFA